MATPESFQDGDLQKVQEGTVPSKVAQHDSMFEPIGGSGDGTLEAILGGVDKTGSQDTGDDATADVTPSTDAAVIPPEAGDEVPPTDATATDVPSTDATEGEDETLEDPMLKEILDKIDAAGQATDEAAGNLDTAIQGGEITDIQKAYNELTVAMQAKDRQIEMLTKQVDNEKGQADRFLNEKFIAESDGREKSKVYEAVMENPVIKDIVIYSINAASDPKYVDRLKEATKKLYEETSGVSVDDILSQNKITEKQGLGDNTFMSNGNVDQKSGLIGGMFEQLPS